MDEIDVDISVGPVRGIPATLVSADTTLLTGRAHIHGWSFRESAGDVAVANEGSVLSPAASATIVSIAGVAPGTYNVSWTVELTGAAGAADANNFQLRWPVGQSVVSVNAGAAGTYVQVTVQITVTATSTVSIIAIAAGTVGVTYTAALSITPVTTSDTVVEIQDGGQPLGEVTLPPNGTDTRWFGPMGVRVSGEITLHVIAGTVSGVVYAKYYK